MLSKTLKSVFGTRNSRQLKRMGKVVKQVNELGAGIKALDDAQLAAKTGEFKARLAKGESLDSLLPEAFAVVREAGERVLGLRHFDVQLIGGMALHEGKIAEMRTGEGKTLVATLPAYFNALTGKSVHLVTVNDYLANRDAHWMGPLYNFLGMSFGVIRAGQTTEEKRDAYNADIVYGTNNEFGFDYLRDNMAFSLEERMSRGLGFAIVDEVDSILIDEARTPLIISGASEDSSELYRRINRMIPILELETEGGAPGHFTLDEKQRQVELTEAGHEFIEEWMIKEGLLEEGDNLYGATNLNLLHHVYSGMRAHALYHRDVEYIVQNSQVVLIDEHTGRTMPGRRLSEGLHQAIEAKEGVSIQSESQTLASTTFQNYFRLYDKLSGMTGTADTEAFEFRQIYGLEVLVIPTNKPQQRQDLNDLVYLSVDEKFDAILVDVKDCMAKGAPVLVGTASVETSEAMSERFRKANIEHKVLNAKYHEQEAEIIAQAGRPGVVTIATNMAGRGTDIVLGGNLEAELHSHGDISDAEKAQVREGWQQRHNQVLAAGGLHILGTERHESRRIDNQLRGRAGRQGDPGVSRFYLSMEDNLMRIFASERVKGFMQALGMEKGEAIEHRMVTNAIEKAQRKVEGRNFDIRKQLLEYDDVANDQRQIIYQQRDDLLTEADISETITAIRRDVVSNVIDNHIPPMSVEEQWNVPALEKQLEAEFAISLPLQQWLDEDNTLHEPTLREKIYAEVQTAYDRKCAEVGQDMRRVEKQIMLQVLDTLWKDHLATMDHLRQGIHLRAYAQKNPKQEYKRESFQLFEQLLVNLKHEVVKFLSHIQIQRRDEAAAIEQARREAAAREQLAFQHAQAPSLGSEELDPGAEESAMPQTYTREQPKVGRNESCPCGSGKKYKQCHGKL